ncbi:MAG: hypothetical protein Ct9H300mP13_6690 [Gammaproteobacteria bacterium]|nr:MAG: hypothetical protein Ct9H300mP13_6690 [Gammaproteobacteria bacterium]
MVDDGTLQDRRGSLTIDERERPHRNRLIEDGRLRGYMQDTLNARLMGVAPTGNGRRESYAHLPMPRMTNTYMFPGDCDPAEILASVDRGLMRLILAAVRSISLRASLFFTSEAYLVEKGRSRRLSKGQL